MRELFERTRKYKTLFVEDEESLREETARFLRKFFPELTVKSNGLEAWEAFQATPFDLLVTDVKMPKMSGNELIEKVKALAPETVTIAISGISSENGHPIIADAKLVKPITIDIFIEMIDKLID